LILGRYVFLQFSEKPDEVPLYEPTTTSMPPACNSCAHHGPPRRDLLTLPVLPSPTGSWLHPAAEGRASGLEGSKFNQYLYCLFFYSHPGKKSTDCRESKMLQGGKKSSKMKHGKSDGKRSLPATAHECRRGEGY